MAGSHNMVLFGDPDDQLYSYHLPLFAGKVNGEQGHVFMHVYQGIWGVKLDEVTEVAYKAKFKKETSLKTPFPFFSFSPRGERFKVPEMICNESFKTKVLSVYGHVESNPNFPAPELLIENNLSRLTKEQTVFARRFDGSFKDHLTYILFGTDKQQYLVHYLTDDENSFDQILAVKIDDTLLGELKKKGSNILVTVPTQGNSKLVKVQNGSQKENNMLSISTGSINQQIEVMVNEKFFKVQVKGSVYYNDNGDLRVE